MRYYFIFFSLTDLNINSFLSAAAAAVVVVCAQRHRLINTGKSPVSGG